VVGATIYFAGGSLSIDSTFPLETSVVDVFNTISQNFTRRSLSSPRSSMSAHVIDEKLVFAGGYSRCVSSNEVDILDLSSNLWTSTSMKSARADVSSVSKDELLIFYSGVSKITSSLDVVLEANKQIEFL
jgi:hypothetical protein